MHADEDAIAAKTERISALESQVAELEHSGQVLSEAYKAALLELGELRAEVKHLNDAITELKQNLEEVKGERDAAQAKVKKLSRQNLLLKVAVGLSLYVLLR